VKSSHPCTLLITGGFIANETNSKLNYRSYLSLSTVRVNDETQDSGEITFKEFNASYASVRVYGRVRGAAGAIAGIFTYLNDTQESDIEMLTRAPAQYIQYSNQPTTLGEPSWEAIPGATVNVSLPHAKLYTDWHVHRLDWTPGRSVFFLDGEQTNTTTLHVPIAHPPSGLYINIWSANSTWSGSMEVGKNATFDILWIELLFNTSQPVGDASPERICTIQDHNATVSGGSVIGKQAKGVDGQWLAWLLLSTVFVLACEFV
jgi:beta-glucanase (GH16 family)